MARRTKEDAEKTRDMLLDAAEKLFLENGITKTSLDAIAKAAGVTRGALYWHFKDKEDLFKAMHERVKLPMDLLFEAESQSDVVAALRNSTVQILQSMATDERTRNVFTILLFRSGQSESVECSCQRHNQSREDALAKMRRKFMLIQKAGRLQDHLNPAKAAMIFHAAILGILSDYLRNMEEYNLKTFVPLFIDATLKGLIKE